MKGKKKENKPERERNRELKAARMRRTMEVHKSDEETQRQLEEGRKNDSETKRRAVQGHRSPFLRR